VLEGDELDKAIKKIMKRLGIVNTAYIRKIAEQIKKIGELSQSSVNMLVAMSNMNADVAEITSMLKTAAALNARDLRKVFDQALDETYTDPRFYAYLSANPDSVRPEAKERVEKYVQTIYRQTAANMYNYSNTTAIKQGYIAAIDNAVLAASTGVTSYTAAMRDTIRNIGSAGMQVYYESGYHRRLDTAVRQNIVDAVNQINKTASVMIGEAINEQAGEDVYDAIEISAHARSAPDHEPVQGHVFLKSEFEMMQIGSPFRDVTGRVYEGFKRPIGEWNCRHTPLSFSTKWSKPTWTDEQLQEFIDQNQQGCIIDGKHRTLYEAMQMMRDIETQVRREKDTAIAAQAAGDNDLRQQCQRNINALVKRYSEISKASGNAEKRERMTVEGFRAVKVPEYSDVLTKFGKDGKIDLDRFQKDLAAGRINTTIDTKQQPKHMLTPEWKNQVKQAIKSGGKPKSRLAKGIDPQEIVAQYAGTGVMQVCKGNHCVDEFVTLPHTAGVTFDAKVGKFIPTHRIQIKYTNSGVHVLPVLERK